MTTTTPTLFLTWYIPCFDRTKQEPLPYETKCYRLDWSLLNEQQIAEVFAIVHEREEEHAVFPQSLDSTVVTMRQEARGPDLRMLKYRQFFKLTNVSEMEALFGEPPRPFQSMRSVDLHAEYVEDENEHPISEIEVFQHVTGQENPIILGHPQSVLRLGPIDMVRQDRWCKRSANMVSHFLSVVRGVCSSSWYRSPSRVTMQGSRGAPGNIVEAIFPHRESTYAVVSFVRQLVGGDKLFNRACRIYEVHTGSAGKRAWIAETRRSSARMLNDRPGIPPVTGITTSELLNCFFYGARMLHGEPNDDAESKWMSLIVTHGRERIVLAVHGAMMQAAKYSALVYPVIRQDFDHWIQVQKLSPPDALDPADLLASYRRARSIDPGQAHATSTANTNNTNI